MAEMLRGFCSQCSAEMDYAPATGWRCPKGCTDAQDAMSPDRMVPLGSPPATTSDAEQPSWWDKPIYRMTEAEYADFARACAEAMRGLGDRVSLTVTRPIGQEEP